jgi:hypothetical protein
MSNIAEDSKIRNWNIDDQQNRDWCKLLLRLSGKKEDEIMEEEVQEVKELTLVQRVEHGLAALGEAIKSIFEAREKEAVPEPEVELAPEPDAASPTELEPESEVEPMETETKAATYSVQSFHGNFGKADENAKWSFSGADGNAILDKGGWPLYKQCHLVTNTSDGATPENKGAYTYPVAKLVDGKPTYFLKSAQTIYAGLRGGARRAKLPAAINEKVLATVKRIYKAFGRETEEMGLKSSMAFAFKAADGRDWWMQWTTNAFTDREGENFQTKALEEFVDRHRGEKVKGEFWYHHIPGTKFGDVYWQAMVGRFLVQAGPFDDTPIAQAFKEFFSQYPDGHEQIAPEGWGTSHGYQYNASDRKDNVYEWVEIKESTVLPRHTASNPWSPYPRIIQRSNVMNAEEKKELEAIGGKALVDLVTREGEQRTKELEMQGIGFKGLSGAMAKVMALMEGVEDPDIKAALSEIYDELQSPDEEELPAPAEGEMALNEEMATTEEEPLPMAMAAAGKPEVAVKKAPVDAATRTEVAETMAALATELRAEVKAAVDAQTKTIVDALTPLLAEVKELRKQDTQKIAEKAAATPAASLRDMVQSVLESQKAQVEDGDPLLARKPQETPFTQRTEGGMPSFLAGMFRE